MDNEEFDEMLYKLYKLGLSNGDLGYAYWYTVICELKAMRKVTDHSYGATKTVTTQKIFKLTK